MLILKCPMISPVILLPLYPPPLIGYQSLAPFVRGPAGLEMGGPFILLIGLTSSPQTTKQPETTGERQS